MRVDPLFLFLCIYNFNIELFVLFPFVMGSNAIPWLKYTTGVIAENEVFPEVFEEHFKGKAENVMVYSNVDKSVYMQEESSSCDKDNKENAYQKELRQLLKTPS